MENTYYILAKEGITISRFHICTWDFSRTPSYIEFGLEFCYNEFHEDSLMFYLACPSFDGEVEPSCLCEKLTNIDNCRFIFNDLVQGTNCIGDGYREGVIVKFDERTALTVLPCSISINKGYFVLTVKKPQNHSGLIYFRVLIKLKKSKIAIRSKGLSKVSHIYDFKINETRNIPETIYELKREQNLRLCRVDKVFCIHAVPDAYNISFVDTKKLKNVRKLESEAFVRYLPEIKQLGKNCYNIVFLKDCDPDGYSIFSVFVEETLGVTHLILAIGVNMLCSSLFALSSWRVSLKKEVAWYSQMPAEYYIAMLLVILIIAYISVQYCRRAK